MVNAVVGTNVALPLLDDDDAAVELDDALVELDALLELDVLVELDALVELDDVLVELDELALLVVEPDELLAVAPPDPDEVVPLEALRDEPLVAPPPVPPRIVPPLPPHDQPAKRSPTAIPGTKQKAFIPRSSRELSEGASPFSRRGQAPRSTPSRSRDAR